MLTKEKTVVEIYGHQYHMLGSTDNSDTTKVASFLDEKIKEIAEKNQHLDFTKLLVLSSLNIADEYLKLKQEYDEIMALVTDEVI